jgi:hypothetical protein
MHFQPNLVRKSRESFGRTSSGAILSFSTTFLSLFSLSFPFLSLLARSQCLKFIKSLGLGNEIFILAPTVGSRVSVCKRFFFIFPPISFARAFEFLVVAESQHHSLAIARQCNIAQKSFPRFIDTPEN